MNLGSAIASFALITPSHKMHHRLNAVLVLSWRYVQFQLMRQALKQSTGQCSLTRTD